MSDERAESPLHDVPLYPWQRPSQRVDSPAVQDVVTGNISGLKTSEIKALERLYRRRVAPAEVVSVELATQLSEIAADLHRQVGVLIDRRGAIQHVVVGDASK